MAIDPPNSLAWTRLAQGTWRASFAGLCFYIVNRRRYGEIGLSISEGMALALSKARAFATHGQDSGLTPALPGLIVADDQAFEAGSFATAAADWRRVSALLPKGAAGNELAKDLQDFLNIGLANDI